jgi:hypothetical protein
MSDFNLIKSEGKFWDTINKIFGDLYEPRKQRKLAFVEAEKIKLIGKAEIEIETMKMKELNNTTNFIKEENLNLQLDLIERTKKRIFNEEIQNQMNIDDIIDKSIIYLPEEISNEPVDNTWTKKFFEKAKYVNDEDMQILWAKILSGELEKPGSVSLKTLQIVENMNKNEAQLFLKFCKTLIKFEYFNGVTAFFQQGNYTNLYLLTFRENSYYQLYTYNNKFLTLITRLV